MKNEQEIKDDDREMVKTHPKTRKSKSKGAKNRRNTGRRSEVQSRNDPSFYFKDPTLMDQVTSFSFNEYLGNSTTVGRDIPYAMRLLFNPSPGWTGETGGVINPSLAGINIASRKLYTRLSSGNAKTTNYAPQDVAFLMLALGEVISTAAWIRRAIKLAFTYNKRNWAYPRDIIDIAGFTHNSVLNNLATVRMQFNTVVNMLNQIAFPRDITYFKKCEFMYSNIYLDSESPMAQSYIFVPSSTWILDESSTPSGTKLTTYEWWVQGVSGFWKSISITSAITQLSTMIQAILDSSTFNYIFSDVLRLYNGDEFVTIPFISEDDVLMPIYDPMVLLQINNLTIQADPVAVASPTKLKTNKNDVISDPDNNAVIYRPTLQYNNAGNQYLLPESGPYIINFPHSMGNPDVAQRVEATRMTTLVTGVVSDTGFECTDATFPDHWCTKAVMYSGQEYVLNAAIPGTVLSSTRFHYKNTTSTLESRLELAALMEKFDYAPRFMIHYANGGGGDAYFGDLDYFTTIDLNYLARVNNLAFTTLFDV